MKSLLLLLWQRMADDLAIQCRTSTDRDLETVRGRVESEGVSFLTITLTNYCKDFERSLDQGFVASNQFAGFRRSGGLPAFLQGFLRLIFTPDGSRLLPHPDYDAIRAIRQLTLVFGKISLECSDARKRKAYEQYVQCEKEVLESDLVRTPEMVSDLSRIWYMLFGKMFDRMERELSALHFDRFLPKHGPGATADRLVGNQKFNQSEWPERLDRILPFGEFALPNWRYFDDSAVDFLEPGRERPVRVVLVPKTLKTPRVIAIEPTAMQYAQQAVLSRFLEGWREDDYLSSFLGFDNQVPNQDMALIGSSSGSLATLDLSEASDRVSNQLVQGLFWPHQSHVSELFDAIRTRQADVDGEIINLVKYASMGSAVTFPVEAMVFLCTIFHGIEQQLNRHLTRRDLSGFVGSVRVYGDDIVIPVHFVHSVHDSLEAFGFKVNSHKSFWTGKFRESCGKEYYDGEDVSIVRLRHVFPADPTDATEVIGLVSFRNQLYYAGLWGTVSWLDQRLNRILKGAFPVVAETSAVLGRHSLSFSYQAEKMDDHLHSPLVRGWVVKAQSPVNRVDGVPALTKALISGFNPDDDHLERSGRPRSVNITPRMASPF
jgi:hypothetical protein